MKPPKIAFFTVMPSPYQRDLFEALAKENEVELTIYYQQPGAQDSPWKRAELNSYERLLPGRGFEFLNVRFQFNRKLPAADEADLWVINGSLTSPSAQWMMRRNPGNSRWIFWGEQIRPTSNLLKQHLQQFLSCPLAQASAIAAVGSRAARDYALRFPGQRIWNIPYHCDLRPYRAIGQKRRTNTEVTFFFCGQMIRRKGIDILLEAFTRLCQGNTLARLLLAGRPGELPALLQTLPVPVRSRIEYAGFKEPHELPEYFARADVFVLPSRYDGWGVVINQALGAGLPVICSEAAGASQDLVDPGQNGLRIPAGDAALLFDAMRKLADDPLLCREMGNYSLEKSREWTAEAGAKKWLKLIRETLASG